MPRFIALFSLFWFQAPFLLPCHPATEPGPSPIPLELHVATTGKDSNLGSATLPFLTLERARDEIRSLKQRGTIPAGGVEVRIHPGRYTVRQSLRLDASDSGTATAPIRYRAAGAEAPTFSGGARLRGMKITTDPEILARLPEAARGKVWEASLEAAGVTRLIPFELGGFSSGRGFVTHPAMELYVDGSPMTLARWPNDEFVKTGDVPGPQTLTAWDKRPGSPEGRFRFEGDRPKAWINEPDAWLYGYWFWDWADSYEKIERIDLDAHEITLAKPWHNYGYRKAQRYFAINLLSELDAPGEWYLDRKRGCVLLMPDKDPGAAEIELSVNPQPMLETDGTSHVRFQGILWECGASDGIRIRGGEGVALEGCTVRRMAGTGIEVRGGLNHVIRSCDIHTLGRGGIALAGGDRRTLTRGGHRVENCDIHHLSRIDHTYTPGVWVDGVGQVIRHNLIHDVASSALRVEGNEHLVELNEVHHVILESDDQGAVDMFGNPTYRGNVYRHNYWHHLGNYEGKGDASHTQRAGIRLDDAICGVVIQGNIFQRCSTGRSHFGGVQIHGGKENIVEGNLFIDTAAAVSFTPWGDKRWHDFVAQSLNAPAIDRQLYLLRYPALAKLAEDNDRNTIRGNVAVRCGALFLRAPQVTESRDNRELPQGTEFPEGPDGRLAWSMEQAAKFGLGSIPFADMGMMEDTWRVRQGTAWTLRTAATTAAGARNP